MKQYVKGAPKPPPPPPSEKAAVTTTAYAAHTRHSYSPGPKVDLEYEELDLASTPREKLAIALYGPAGGGKTAFGASMPGNIGVVPLNRKTMETVAKTAKKLGKRVFVPKFDLIRSANPMATAMLPPNCDPEQKRPPVKVDINREQPMCCAIHNGRWAVDRTKQAALDLYAKPQVDGILLDGFDILTEDMTIAHFGRSERIMARDRGPLNKEMIEFLGALSGKHLVLTMGQKEVWVKGSDGKDKPSGKFDWAGWRHLDYHVNCICAMTVKEDYNEDKHDFRWALSVVLCQGNPALMGVAGQDMLTDDTIGFPFLASRIYADTEPEDWE